MNRKIIFSPLALCLLLLTLIIAGCCCKGNSSPFTPSPTIPLQVEEKGDREIAVDVSMASDNDYNRAFELAKEVGLE